MRRRVRNRLTAAATALVAIGSVWPAIADADLLGRVKRTTEAGVTTVAKGVPPIVPPAGLLAAPVRPVVRTLGAEVASAGALTAPLVQPVAATVKQTTDAVVGVAPVGVTGRISPTLAATVKGVTTPLVRDFRSGNARHLLAPAGVSAAPSPLSATRAAPVPNIPATMPIGRQSELLNPTQAAPAEADSRARLAARVQAHPELLTLDNAGATVVRDEILAVGLSLEAVRKAQGLGFQIKEQSANPALGLSLAIFRPPPSLTTAAALRQLQRLDPAAQYDLNHLYVEAGGTARPTAAGKGPTPKTHPNLRIGLIDHGVDPRHPSLNRVTVEQRGFAGAAVPQAHGLATASLLAGVDQGFRSAAPGARLFVADIYGAAPTGGSAASLIKALAWMAEVKAPVINISLVGPPNAAVKAVVAALIAKGHVIVAAAGNDGPNAAPLYPAAYPDVVAVTAVDRRPQVLPEAGRGPHIVFAARGADMAAAGPHGYVVVRGTSFAAPLVAGRLARALTTPNREAARTAIATLTKEAVDLGVRGPDPVYGRGLVASDLWTAPTAVAARGALFGP